MNHNILVTAIGNPNVDVTLKLKSLNLFEKYNLPCNKTYPTTDAFLQTIEREFEEHAAEKTLSPGGCSQNTLRILQWLLNTKFNSAIVGSVGSDEYSVFLKEELKNNGVVTNYSVVEARTSFVFILMYKDCSTAVYGTETGAARLYSKAHLLSDAEALLSIRNSKIVLLEGYFTMHSAEVGLEVLKICTEHHITTCFNISGEYVPQKSATAVVPFVQNCDIVIGTRNEFLACCQVMKVSTDDFQSSLMAVHKIMESTNIAQDYKLKMMKKYKKILIVTDGTAPVHCVTSDGLIKFNIPKVIDERLIKDVTGAGDSFLAGVFYGILNELPIASCLEIGSKVAAEIIQDYGCKIPNKSPYSVISN